MTGPAGLEPLEPDDTPAHPPECTACEHDCPWRRHVHTPGGPPRLLALGAPFCATCDDHSEAVHAGYGDAPCGCGGTDCADTDRD